MTLKTLVSLTTYHLINNGLLSPRKDSNEKSIIQFLSEHFQKPISTIPRNGYKFVRLVIQKKQFCSLFIYFCRAILSSVNEYLAKKLEENEEQGKSRETQIRV